MSSIQINHVSLAGQLTRDPEKRTVGSDVSVCTMRIAVNERSARRGRTRHFLDVIAYGEQGEAAAKWLRKGELIYVDGRLEFREWVTATGARAEKVRVVASQIEFLGRVCRGPRAPGVVAAEREQTWDEFETAIESMGADVAFANIGAIAGAAA
jgi:single stranded DNA-binding protein